MRELQIKHVGHDLDEAQLPIIIISAQFPIRKKVYLGNNLVFTKDSISKYNNFFRIYILIGTRLIRSGTLMETITTTLNRLK